MSLSKPRPLIAARVLSCIALLLLAAAGPARAQQARWEKVSASDGPVAWPDWEHAEGSDVELEALRHETEQLRARLREIEFALRERSVSAAVLSERRGAGPGESEAQSGGGPEEPGLERSRPQARRAAEIPSLDERGSVFRSPRSWTIEPQLQLSTSSHRRVDFSGLLVSPVLIGDLNISGIERESVVSGVNLRWTLSERFQTSLRVPFLSRSDRRSVVAATDSGEAVSQWESLEGRGFGDVELGLHYQLSAASAYWPALTGTLSVQAPTGTGPYEDLDRSDRLATGTGSWSIEPSLTAVFQTDPAVLYGALFYAHSFEPRIDRGEMPFENGGVALESVRPGDSLGASVGFGVALNARTSFSIGYSHRYVRSSVTRTRTRTCGIPADGSAGETTCSIRRRRLKGDPLHIGEIQLGLSYQSGRRSSVQATVAIGVTESAPDVRFSLRLPFTWRSGE